MTFRYAGRAISAEYRDGVLVREYLADEAGGITALIIPAGQDNPGTYLVVWNGHGDAIGLWRIRTDGSLELANAFTYDPWGVPAISSTTNSATEQPYGDLGFRFLYVGRYGVAWDGRDGPPLYHMGARHYHATLGRFLTPDPAALEANLYGYAENNPLTKIDPEGEAAVCLVPVVGQVVCIEAAKLALAGVVAMGSWAATQWVLHGPRITIPCLWDCGSGIAHIAPVPRRVIEKALRDAGYRPDRNKGGHEIWEKPGAKPIPVPNHREIKGGTARKILEDIRNEMRRMKGGR